MTETSTQTTPPRPPSSAPRGGWLSLLIVLALTTAAGAVVAWWAFIERDLFLFIAAPPAGFALGLWIAPGRGRRRTLAAMGLTLLTLLPLSVWAYQMAMLHRPRPEPTRRMLYQGVEYIREVIDEPAAVVHIIRVDLAADGVEVLVTPPDFPGEELPWKARRASTFLREHDLQVAINAGAYHPYERTLFPPKPMPGEPIGVLGASASRGVVYSEPREHFPMINITADNRVVIGEHPPEPFYNAVTGIKEIDVAQLAARPDEPDDRRARTTLYTDETRRVLFIVVVDGDQPPYAVGISRNALTRLLQRHGAHHGIGLDAGGASTLVVESPHGWPQLLNRPVNLGIPGFERPIGTHLGIRAKPLESE